MIEKRFMICPNDECDKYNNEDKCEHGVVHLEDDYCSLPGILKFSGCHACIEYKDLYRDATISISNSNNTYNVEDDFNFNLYKKCYDELKYYIGTITIKPFDIVIRKDYMLIQFDSTMLSVEEINLIQNNIFKDKELLIKIVDGKLNIKVVF